MTSSICEWECVHMWNTYMCVSECVCVCVWVSVCVCVCVCVCEWVCLWMCVLIGMRRKGWSLVESHQDPLKENRTIWPYMYTTPAEARCCSSTVCQLPISTNQEQSQINTCTQNVHTNTLTLTQTPSHPSHKQHTHTNTLTHAYTSLYVSCSSKFISNLFQSQMYVVVDCCIVTNVNHVHSVHHTQTKQLTWNAVISEVMKSKICIFKTYQQQSDV